MVSIESVPSEFEVFTKPLVVRLEIFERLMTLVPENVLLSPRSVEDANLQVVVEKVYALPFPSTATPPVPMPVKYGVPETVRAVVEAYGKVEATVVEVEVK